MVQIPPKPRTSRSTQLQKWISLDLPQHISTSLFFNLIYPADLFCLINPDSNLIQNSNLRLTARILFYGVSPGKIVMPVGAASFSRA
jgi:hypothetical protein